ncbi:MAG TPA: hemolysin family protein [Thermoanaerobaculia bacterium]|nr:hemolysin family protein [Thermoanaerobaculia bacterium]
MGSNASGPEFLWVLVAALSGLLFLIFDAARHFVQQLGPVRLRGVTGGETDTTRHRWTQYDAANFHLGSGALLQLALVAAFGSSIMAFAGAPDPRAIAISTIIWAAVVISWKFVLAMIPDDAAEVLLRGIVPVTHFFFYLFWPVLYPLRRIVARLERADEAANADEVPSDADVQAYIDVGEEEGILEASEGKLVQQIVDFGDRVARELMTPRIDVFAFDAERPMHELARMFSDSKYSRIPIYQNSIDNIIGIVHIKEMYDAILKGEDRPVADLARPPYVVSETKKASDLLREFQSEHIQAAVVVDEYGGTAGMITIEDVIEELVGEIADEHEEEETTIVEVGDGTYLVNGLVRVEQLEELLGAELAGEDYETVAGLIFTSLGRVPNAGTVITKNGFRFEVDRADRRRIYRVKVSRDPDWEAEREAREA